MKKILAIVMTVLMLAVMAVPTFAADYTPKTITLVVNADGTASLPEGYVVYIGDTIILPRKEIVAVGDFVNRNTGETETGAMIIANTYNIYRDKAKLGSAWSDTVVVSDDMAGSNGWKESGATMAKAGTYRYQMVEWRDSAWSAYYSYTMDIITFEVKDPATESEIVLPPDAQGTTSTEAPVESTEAPVESTEAPVESTEAPVESTPAESTEAPVESTPAESNTEAPAATDDTDTPSFPIIWVIVGAVAVVVVVAIVIVATKKKKA